MLNSPQPATNPPVPRDPPVLRKPSPLRGNSLGLGGLAPPKDVPQRAVTPMGERMLKVCLLPPLLPRLTPI